MCLLIFKERNYLKVSRTKKVKNLKDLSRKDLEEAQQQTEILRKFNMDRKCNKQTEILRGKT